MPAKPILNHISYSITECEVWFPPDIKHGYNVQLAEEEP